MDMYIDIVSMRGKGEKIGRTREYKGVEPKEPKFLGRTRERRITPIHPRPPSQNGDFPPG